MGNIQQQPSDGISVSLNADWEGMHFQFGSDGLNVTVSVIFEALRSFFNMLVGVWNNLLRVLSGQMAYGV